MNTILTYVRNNRLLSKVVKAAKEHGYNGDVWADHPPCGYQSELSAVALILIDAGLGNLSPDENELTKRWATAAVMNHDSDSDDNLPAFVPINRPTPPSDLSAVASTAKPLPAKPLSAQDLIRRRSAL